MLSTCKVERGGMFDMNNFVMVKNVFRADIPKQYQEGFNDLHLLVYIYMQRFMTLNTNTMNFTTGWLVDELKISNRAAKDNIISSLDELVGMNLIEFEKVEGKINIHTRLKTRLVDDDISFTKVYNPEIDKILNLDIDIRARRTMLFLYVDIASRIDEKGYCFPSFANFKQDLDITSDNRITDALELLQQYQLIDYDNVGQVVIDNQVTQANNVYVLCNNKNYKETLQRALNNRKKQYESGKIKIIKAEQSNLQRSIKQTINNLVSKYNDKSISASEIEKLNELELEYYNLISSNSERLFELKDEFVTIALDEKLEIVNSKVDIKLDDIEPVRLTEEEIENLFG